MSKYRKEGYGIGVTITESKTDNERSKKLNNALRDFKQQTIKADLNTEIRERRYFEKKSSKKRKQKQKAIYSQYLKNND